jgi:hypothetical protein
LRPVPAIAIEMTQDLAPSFGAPFDCALHEFGFTRM